MVGEPESDGDFDDAVRRFMDALATTDPADAPREPSYAHRVRAARQADLQRRLAEAAEHDRRLAERETSELLRPPPAPVALLASAHRRWSWRSSQRRSGCRSVGATT